MSTGTAATFSVVATGTSPTYQWSRNGTPITGASGATYTLSTTTASDSGASFTVAVTNSAGQVTSTAAVLTVMDAAAITAQPQAQTVTTGDTATFSVTATGSSLSYQWNKNGTPINGATSASYTTPAVALADSGSTFTVTVSNTVSRVTSNSASLNANADPEGVYLGTLTYSTGTTASVFAIVLKNGTAAAFVTDHIVQPDVVAGSSLHGLVIQPTGATFTSPFTALLQSGYQFVNGHTTSSGTVTGTVAPRSSITGTYTSDVDSGTFQLTALTSDYARAAAFATIAGTYTYASPFSAGGTDHTYTGTMIVSSDGTATATTSTGCTSSSITTTIPDATHNAYALSADFTCTSAPTSLAFNGLAAFFPASTGAGIAGPNAFTSDTLVTIEDDPSTSLSYLIIAAR